MRRLIHAPVLLALVALLASCASGPPVTGGKVVSLESRGPLRVAGGSREIVVEVVGEDTVFLFGEGRIACRGYQGFVGEFQAAKGWARVGALHLSWEGDMLRIRSRKGWAQIELTPRINLFADQDGTVGRSIFR
ncbi:MAG: hypothetical protein R3F20_07010 [Planctomycetota bacterium]